MKTFRTDFLVAALVIVCSVVMLVALTIAISGTHLTAPKATLTIDLPSAVGLDKQAEVRYAGANVGRIRTVRPLTDEEREKVSPDCAIRVVADIHHHLPQLRVGTTASITADTVLGEKYLNPDHYTTGTGQWTDNRGMYQGEDADTCGWSVHGSDVERLRPMQDRRGLNRDYTFGSCHDGSLQMVFCDGSVRPVPYDVDPQVHARLGNRKDGQPIDGTAP